MGRRESFQAHDMRCPESFYFCRTVSNLALSVLWDFTATHTPLALFLRRVEAGDSCARLVAPAMASSRDIF